MNKKKPISPLKAYSPQYAEKKPFFSEKEIIFRSAGRAKVLKISSQIQVIFLFLFCLIGVWSFYSYHMYNKSGRIIHTKDRELIETRDAYVDLMSDFATLHKNIGSMISSLDNNGNKAKKDFDQYKRQAMLVEDKIKQITEEKDWVDNDAVNERMNLREALLQRDIATSERDELKKQMETLEGTLEDIKKAEMEVFEKMESVTGREIKRIKSAFSQINVPLKKSGLYFNPLANSKRKTSRGGPYIPSPQSRIKDKRINEKISQIFQNAEDLEYYREVVQYVPMGKPVWSYWVSSKFGYRSDPFNKKKAGHKGVDLASRTGNKVKVMAKGRVIDANQNSRGYGKLVVVDHGNGFKTKYAHMSKIHVKKGEYLNINDTVGEVGSTGRSTGPHLHYEVLYMGIPVDPMPFIQAKAS